MSTKKVSVKGYDRKGTYVTQFERKGGHVKSYTRTVKASTKGKGKGRRK